MAAAARSRRPPTSSSAKRWRTWSSTPARRARDGPRAAPERPAPVEVVDDGVGGADPRGSGCAGSPTGWRRSAAAGRRGPARRRNARRRGDPVRVVIADDSVLIREGLARRARRGGFEVAAQPGTPMSCRTAIRGDAQRRDGGRAHAADADGRGARAAKEIRAKHPDIAMFCSRRSSRRSTVRALQRAAGGVRLPAEGPRGSRIDEFLESVRRVGTRRDGHRSRGRFAPLMGRRREVDPLEDLSPHESERYSG